MILLSSSSVNRTGKLEKSLVGMRHSRLRAHVWLNGSLFPLQMSIKFLSEFCTIQSESRAYTIAQSSNALVVRNCEQNFLFDPEVDN